MTVSLCSLYGNSIAGLTKIKQIYVSEVFDLKTIIKWCPSILHYQKHLLLVNQGKIFIHLSHKTLFLTFYEKLIAMDNLIFKNERFVAPSLPKLEMSNIIPLGWKRKEITAWEPEKHCCFFRGIYRHWRTHSFLEKVKRESTKG